jgi:hypothetical protein
MEELDLLGQLEQTFDNKHVSIVEFAESSKFCNRTLYPRQKLLLKIFFLEELDEEENRVLDYWESGGYGGEEISISPGIRERMQYLKDNGYKHFREIVLVGGRRCSKGFITGLSLAYMVNNLLQLQDPNKYYGIDSDKEIVFSVVAAAQEQAKDMQYADFSSMVNSCNAMQRNIYKMQELEFSLMTETDIRKVDAWKRAGRRVQRDISTIRGKAQAANSRTIRGSATMGIVFDEFAHFQQGENDQSDSEIYAAAIPALAQFGRDGMIFCNSSPYSKVGKFYDRYRSGMAAADDPEPHPEFPYDPTILSLRFPSWALFEGWWEDPHYSGPQKCITVSPDWDHNKRTEDGSYFYTEDDRAAIRIAQNEEASDKEKFKVERRGHFAEVIDAYLDPDMVDRMYRGRPIYAADNSVEYASYNVNWDDSTNIYQYYAHLDPSSTTAGFGFAMGHIETYMVNGKAEEHVVFDIIRRWNPKEFEGGAIEWEPILHEVLKYCHIFRPQRLTFDQHQNMWPMEWLDKELRRRGIGETRVFQKTADIQRNWSRAEVFRTALYHGRVHAPSDTKDCEYSALELKYLQEIKTARVPRVEKQDVGPVQTKDIADCIMEVVEALIGAEYSRRDELGASQMAVGAPGGYGGSRRTATPQELAGWYGTGGRIGEQGIGRAGIARDRETSSNPSRRAFGGRPVPRNMRHRGLPGR